MVANATHPKRVGFVCLDVELALLVGDGAIVRHFADDVCVANRFQAVGGDHIAVKVHAFVFRFVLALREGGGEGLYWCAIALKTRL